MGNIVEKIQKDKPVKSSTDSQSIYSNVSISDDEDELTKNILNAVREPLIVLDKNLKVVAASRSFYNVFKVKPEDTIGKLLYDLGNKQWNIPRLLITMKLNTIFLQSESV